MQSGDGWRPAGYLPGISRPATLLWLPNDTAAAAAALPADAALGVATLLLGLISQGRRCCWLLLMERDACASGTRCEYCCCWWLRGWGWSPSCGMSTIVGLSYLALPATRLFGKVLRELYGLRCCCSLQILGAERPSSAGSISSSISLALECRSVPVWLNQLCQCLVRLAVSQTLLTLSEILRGWVTLLTSHCSNPLAVTALADYYSTNRGIPAASARASAARCIYVARAPISGSVRRWERCKMI